MSNGTLETFEKIRGLTGGKYHTPADDDDNDDDHDNNDDDDKDDSDGDKDDSDGEVEIIDGPPSQKSAGPSQRSSASRSSAAASAGGSSRQSASSTSDKKGTNKKTIKTYGGKKQARNLKTTGDDVGEVIDISTVSCGSDDEDEEGEDEIEMPDDDTDCAPAKVKGKSKPTGKEKGKGKTAKPAKSTSKATGKGKTAKPAKSTSKATGQVKTVRGSLEDDPIEVDEDSADNANQHVSQTSGSKTAAAGNSTKQTDEDVRMSPTPDPSGSKLSSTTGGDSSTRMNEDKEILISPALSKAGSHSTQAAATPVACEFKPSHQESQAH
jgi:hypothetical protein